MKNVGVESVSKHPPDRRARLNLTLRGWPWWSSSTSGVITLALMLILYAGEPLRGIALASATNMSVFVFCLVGGAVSAYRAAGGVSLWWALVRALTGGLVPALLCWLAVVLLRQAILADEPLAESVFQDGFGRSIVVYQVAVAVGLLTAIVKWTVHRVRAALGNGVR